jgi:superoxide reductase
MTKISEVYRCKICGNLVKVIESGVGHLVCCGQPMNLEVKSKLK